MKYMEQETWGTIYGFLGEGLVMMREDDFRTFKIVVAVAEQPGQRTAMKRNWDPPVAGFRILDLRILDLRTLASIECFVPVILIAWIQCPVDTEGKGDLSQRLFSSALVFPVMVGASCEELTAVW